MTKLSKKTRKDILKTIKMYYTKHMYKHSAFEYMTDDNLIKELLTFYRY